LSDILFVSFTINTAILYLFIITCGPNISHNHCSRWSGSSPCGC